VQPIPVTRANLVGQSETHLCSTEDAAALGVQLHAEAVAPFRALRAAASERGFDLTILSGFRGFERQLSIWNRKATGELAVLDSNASRLDITRLSPKELVFAILRWSALPGASRHHWGTDMDVYDLNAKPPGYEVDLVPAEVDAGGMFAPLHEWLDTRIADGSAFGFVRPYDADRGGIAPERWHLSYSPVATEYTRMLTTDVLRTTIEAADLQLKDVVLAHLDEIAQRFVKNINPAAA
jgi:LAS superfamily LD-carboxypeptidase LdcB